ncbi:GWT1-domain-containing protein [Dichotomocladium elegans]|nr:GWT1-domain-containing protein [Dichotomocladium elegans]
MLRDEEYKRAQEAWVSNCSGGSIVEILTVCSSLVASHLLWTVLTLGRTIPTDGFLVQMIIYVIPILFSQTIAADYSAFIPLSLFSLCLILPGSRSRPSAKSEGESRQADHKGYLTIYRAGIMLVTCLAILAVDFPVFPRRFAKVETFGTSLARMDVGVGSVVFSSGIVSSRAYLPKETSSHWAALYKSMRSALPILILGFLRLVLTKGVDYQEHTSEYGLHWNFFFTLGFLPPFVTLASFLRRWTSFGFIGFTVIATYQFCLMFGGLQHWLLEAPRTDLLSANKEGISSFAGYLAIFLFGLDSGLIAFCKGQDKTTSNSKNVATRLTVRAGSLWLILAVWRFITDGSTDLEVSRRMCNLPYVIWVVAFNLSLIVALMWADYFYPIPGRGPTLLDAINVNGLVTFLWANVLTGLVNLSMQTLYASTAVSLGVLSCYIILVTLLPWVLWGYFGIRVKL